MADRERCPHCGSAAPASDETCPDCGRARPVGAVPRGAEAAGAAAPGAKSETDLSGAVDGAPAQEAAPVEEGMPEAQAAMTAAAAAQRAQGPARTPAKRAPKAGPAAATVVPFVTAVVVTIVFQLFIDNAVGSDTYLFRLFRPPGGWVMSLVPGLIASLLVWTLADLVLKYRAWQSNETDLDRREIRQLPRLVAQEPTGVLQRRLLALVGSDRPVARRLLWLLHYLESHADAQRTHELLRHQSDLDADTAAAGYRTVKLFVWAMPILGFVGTVLGISLAVGGFSEFLTADLDIEDVSVVTAELGNVASGLSFAFDTTLLGLLAGLLANVVSSGVQKRDEHFFTRLDELALSIVANRQDAPAVPTPAVANPLTDFGAAFEQVMRARLDELSVQIERTQGLMNGLGETSSRMSVALTESISSVRRTVQEMGNNLEGVSEALAGSMSEVGDRVTASHDRFQRGLEGLQDALERTHRQGMESARSQSSVEQAVQQLSVSIAEFGDLLAEFRTEQNTLTPVLQKLAGPLELKLVPKGE